ncbi:hypothetical protein SAMN04487972_101186 [Paracoccus halophilus]|uniref:Uncharacterized protein n=1 Tax=Paracoccus halophilus TaxID=376733 RepID=A0A1I0SGY5_9RHOB|nr:hypothetical protein SAMN04487972_101186 [Paracoccus halophilus]
MLGRPLRSLNDVSSRTTCRPENEGEPSSRHRSEADGERGLCQAFVGGVVDHVQDPEPPPASELIMHEAERPMGVGAPRSRSKGASKCLVARLALAYHQSLFAIQAVDQIDPGRLGLPTQQDDQPPIAEMVSLIGKIAQPAPQRRLRRTSGLVAHPPAIRARDLAGQTGSSNARPLRLHGRRHQFLASSSFISASYRICSATSFFSLRLSSSSARSLLAP